MVHCTGAMSSGSGQVSRAPSVRAAVLIRRGHRHEQAGRLVAAERDYRGALAALRRTPGRTRQASCRLARALSVLGGVLQTQRRYLEAEPVFREAIALLERTLGPDHLEVAIPLHNLADCYTYLARFLEAGPIYQRTLAITERALGPDHPEVATVYHNLGGLEHAAGNWTRGEPFARKSVRIRTRALGPTHPAVAADLTALAALLDQQKKYGEAELLYRRALTIVERAYGAEHHAVAVSLNNLAAVCWARGRTAEAERMYRRTLEIEVARLGDSHPKVGVCLNNLAALLRADRPVEAASLFRQALAILRRALGPAHPSVGVCLANYGSVLDRLGRGREARACATRGARILSKVEAVNDDAVAMTGTISPDHTPFRLLAKPSPIHRVGVYADEPIPPRRKVIEYTGERVNRREGRRRWDPKRSYLFQLDSYWHLDGAIGGSGAEYINHSCEPNLRARLVRGHILYFSKRPIARGEELTVDYHYSDELTRMPCHCGAPSCRGTMNISRRDTRNRRRAPRRPQR
jgi:tetratricopeptide (TPR) repeat protein